MKKIWLILICLMAPLFAQSSEFSEITKFKATLGEYVVSEADCSWVVERYSGSSVTSYYYEMYVAKNNDWDGPSLRIIGDATNNVIPMTTDGFNMNLRHTVTELTSGFWSFKLRIVKKAGNLPVTDWSDTSYVTVPDDLGAPTITFNNLLPNNFNITTPEVYLSFGGSDTASYKLYWGRDTNLPDQAELSRPVARVNSVINLDELYELKAGDDIFFKVSASENNQITWSGIYQLTYDPDFEFMTMLQHTANKFTTVMFNGVPVEVPEVETDIFLDIPESTVIDAVRITFIAKVSDTIFGTPRIETFTQAFFPGTTYLIPTLGLFTDIHRSPIKMISNFPVNAYGVIRTYWGAKHVAKFRLATKVSRDLVFSGIESDTVTVPGLAISNMSESDSNITVWIEYFDPDVFADPPRVTAGGTIVVPAYGEAVFLLHDVVPNMPVYWTGKVFVSSPVPVIGIASMTSVGPTNNTIDYSESD